MKFNSKRAAVCLLAICQTTFQFSSAWAQEPATMKTQTQRSRGSDELATPSIYGIPQRGTKVIFGYNRAESEYTTTETESKSATDTFRTEVLAAVSPTFFLGASWEYAKGENKTHFDSPNGTRTISDGTSDGMRDPSVMAGLRANWDSASLLSAMEVAIPTGDHESESKVGTYNSNNKEGGGIINPKLAVFTNDKNSVLFGAEFSYKIRLERTSKHKSISFGDVSTQKTRGGNTATLSLMLESSLASRYGAGGAISYLKTEDSKTDYLDRDLISGPTSYTSDSMDALTGTIYGRFQATRRLTVVPAAMYARVLKTDFGTSSIKSQNIWAGMLQASYQF